MNCFKHNESHSVGVCRYCFKGVCLDCAIDFNDGVACSEYCLEKAKSTVQAMSNTVLAQRGAKRGRFIGPTFLTVLGLFYLAYAFYCNEIFAFSGALGLVLTLLGSIMFVYNRKYFKPLEDKTHNE